MTQLNIDEAREWLSILYGDTQGMLHVCSTGDWEGRVFDCGDIEGPLRYVTQLDQAKREGIYVRACTLRQRPPKDHRGGDELSLYLPGLWADIDIAGPGHKTTRPLPANVEQAMQVVKAAGLPDPSHWVHSGGGLYAWWLLRDPVEVDDLESFRALSSAWQKCLEHGAAKLGVYYGSGVGDLSRVLRLPGTVNRKAGLERPCTALEGYAWNGPTYTLEALTAALVDATPPPPEPGRVEQRLHQAEGERPGDLYNSQTQWSDILGPLGWKWVYRRGDKWYLMRPGKERGTSATISTTTDRLWVFSDAAPPFEPLKHYSKFEAFAALEHGGNFTAAAADLANRGFKVERDYSYQLGTLDTTAAEAGIAAAALPVPVPSTPPAAVATVQATPVTTGSWRPENIDPRVFSAHQFTACGAGGMYADVFHSMLKYRAGKWWVYDGRVWREDEVESQDHAAKVMLQAMGLHAKTLQRDEETRGRGELLDKFNRKLCNAAAPSAPRWARSDPRMATRASDFDPNPNLVSVHNGVLDIRTGVLHPHDPKFMNTKMVDAAFDPQAKAARWEKFLDEVLPNPQVQRYVQRGIGYTLLGTGHERALFLLYGESGSGKSQFIKALQGVFGDYAETASSATFMASSRGNSLTNDLNDLKGKRFVSLSELDSDEKLQEALIKRVTGGDEVKSRALFQENTKWKAQFALWMATNFLPRVNSDDNAIWNRVKPIKFPMVIKHNGKEERGLGEKMFAEEASGILNWILEGVRMYLEEGLEDIPEIIEEVEAYRDDVDVVKQFMRDAEENHLIRVDQAGVDSPVMTRQLHHTYQEWSHRNNIKPLGERRFGQRIVSLGFERKRMAAGSFWTGIGIGNAGMLGTMGTPYPRR